MSVSFNPCILSYEDCRKKPVKHPSTRKMLDDVDLKLTLNKAVQDANLSKVELYALNNAFYPDGNGFKINSNSLEQDEFIPWPKLSQEDENIFLERALNKLKTVLTGNL